jgi:cyanophycinase
MIGRHVARSVGALLLASCSRFGPQGASAATEVKVGPPRGSVIVVGGGNLGPEIYAKFIELAGGPDAPIAVVPTAAGLPTYPPQWFGVMAFRAAGAKNVFLLHTTDRAVANSDSFVAPLARAGGVWFDGGRHYRLVDAYAGTRTERAFHDVLARGGVTGGSSAGASILASYLVRGAPSNNNLIMAYPAYEKGFAFLRGVAIDQHVVARERLADLADSILPRHPELLGISEDEGTAWVVRADTGEIIGRSKAFVYGGKDQPDSAKPFLTLWPGDKYNLAARRVVHRAIEESPLTQSFVDSVFAAFGRPGAPIATVLVAQAGKVYVDAAYGVSPQPKFMPATTMPNFELRGISDALNSSLARAGRPDPGDTSRAPSYSQLVRRRIFGAAGMHKTTVDSTTRTFSSNVDELYRWELVLAANASSDDADASTTSATATPDSPGWHVDTYRGVRREGAYGTADGRRNAFVRFPERRVSIIVLTDSDAVDARVIAERIANRLFAGTH